MVRRAKVRVVVFLPPDLVDQYTALAKKYSVPRSELLRLAIQRGHRSMEAWCERNRREFSAEGVAPETGSVARKSGVGGSGSDQESSPFARLEEFCRVLVDREPDLASEQIAVMAKAQAAVFGVPDSEVEELVSGMLAELFPAELEESEGSPGAGGGVDLD